MKQECCGKPMKMSELRKVPWCTQCGNTAAELRKEQEGTEKARLVVKDECERIQVSAEQRVAAAMKIRDSLQEGELCPEGLPFVDEMLVKYYCDNSPCEPVVMALEQIRARVKKRGPVSRKLMAAAGLRYAAFEIESYGYTYSMDRDEMVWFERKEMQ